MNLVLNHLCIFEDWQQSPGGTPWRDVPVTYRRKFRGKWREEADGNFVFWTPAGELVCTDKTGQFLLLQGPRKRFVKGSRPLRVPLMDVRGDTIHFLEIGLI